MIWAQSENETDLILVTDWINPMKNEANSGGFLGKSRWAVLASTAGWFCVSRRDIALIFVHVHLSKLGHTIQTQTPL